MIGRVVSTKMTNTATILVVRKKMHPLYKKSFISTKKYLVDDRLKVSEGDVVEVVKIKPVSKRKHWQIVKVLGKDIIALGKTQLKKEAKEAIEQVMPLEERESDIKQEADTKKADTSEKKTSSITKVKKVRQASIPIRSGSRAKKKG